MIKLNRQDSMKLFGIITMLIDHIGVLFFPSLIILRIIGRLTLPVFAFGIAEGYKYTKDKTKTINTIFYKSKNIYLLKLVLFGLISQIPYTLVFDTLQVNIILVFALSLFLLDSLETKRHIGILFSLLILSFVTLEAFIIAPVMVLTFYYRQKIFKEKILLILLVQLIAIYGSIKLKNYNIIQLYSIFCSLGILITVKYKQKDNIPRKIPKYFFYLFYPLHLALLGLILYI